MQFVFFLKFVNRASVYIYTIRENNSIKLINYKFARKCIM